MPFLTALIYLSARGRGMAERPFGRSQSQTDAYIQEVAGGKSSAQDVADAKALLDSGTITRAEFDTLKAKALA